MKRKKWTTDEDKILLSIKDNNKDFTWAQISKQMMEYNINKKSNQCKDRWTNHLNPKLIKTEWTKTEDDKLLELCEKFKGKWKKITKKIKGRSDNCVKNRFFAILRKTLRKCFKNSIINFSINNLRPKVLCDLFLNKLYIDLGKNNKSKIEIKEFLLKKIQKRNFSYEKNKKHISNIISQVEFLNIKYLKKKKNIDFDEKHIPVMRIKKISKKRKEFIYKENNKKLLEKFQILKEERFLDTYYKFFAKLEETLTFYKKDKLIDNNLEKNKIMNLYQELSSCCKRISKNITYSDFDLEELINFKNENLNKYFLELDVPEDLVSAKNNRKESQASKNQIIIPKFKAYPKSDFFSLLSVNSESNLNKPLNSSANKYSYKDNLIEQAFFDNKNYDLSSENGSKKISNSKIDKLLTSSCYNINLEKLI